MYYPDIRDGVFRGAVCRDKRQETRGFCCFSRVSILSLLISVDRGHWLIRRHIRRHIAIVLCLWCF